MRRFGLRWAVPSVVRLPGGGLAGGLMSVSAAARARAGPLRAMAAVAVSAARTRSACSATSPALAGRSAGSLAVRSVTSVATAAGTHAGSGGNGCCWCAKATAKGSPWNGAWPVRH